MEKKIFTVAIIGVGARGANAYGWQLHEASDRFNVVALCDPRPERLTIFGEKFEVPENACFTDETEFFKEKRADLILIATPDNDHTRHCLKAFELGYDIMVEKPLTEKREDCEALLAAQKKYGGKVLVCHVLRYAPLFLKAEELIESGKIGKLVAINALERVGFAHQAHSYVRGNWRNREVAAPMILAKCCHDLDLLQWYAKSKCKSISSVGDLAYFRPENAPEGATERCLDCKLQDTCPYSAKAHYLTRWNNIGKPVNSWPFNVVVNEPVTEEKLYNALKEGPYGRCVYHCDNDVVDHEITEITFENGVKASLMMTAFTQDGGRRIHFHGTLGEIILEEQSETVTVNLYEGYQQETHSTAALQEGGYGHGGGDIFIIRKLYDLLTGESDAATTLEASIESHLMGICAEESRLKGGKLIYIHK